MANSQVPYFKAWAIYSVTTLLLSFLCGMAIGAVLGFLLGMAGMPIQTIQVAGAVGGVVLGLVVSFIMFKWAVDKFIIPAVVSPTSVM